MVYLHGIFFLALAASSSASPVTFGHSHVGRVLSHKHHHNQFRQEHAVLSKRQSSTYTVNAGDTGYAIAASLGIDFSALEAANPGTNWYNLQVGQVLQTSSSTSETPSSPSSSSNPSNPSSPSSSTTSSTSSSTSDTSDTSKVVSASTSSTYTVQSGDTGDSIATSLGCSFSDLEAANPNVSWWWLQIGQVLQVPGGSSGTSSDPTSSAASPASSNGGAFYSASYPYSQPSTTGYSWPTSQASVSAAQSSFATSTSSASPAATSSATSPDTPTDTNTASISNGNAISSLSTSTGASSGSDSYTFYTGDGSTSAGWPAQSSWLSFSAMWTANVNFLGQSCSDGVTPNSADEDTAIHDSILSVASASKMDPRFILAIIIQESSGCVRVPTTQSPGAGSHSNPGLMQSFSGTGTCNVGGAQTSPCPETEVLQMIEDGTQGTVAGGGDGLVQDLNADFASNGGIVGAEAFYRTARIYNSGSVDSSGDLGKGGATHCYASDVANRLMGWVTAARTCTLD